MSALRKMFLHINGVDRMIICDPKKGSLAGVLRRLGLTGIKLGCRAGQCGACSVILNGRVVRSCMQKIDKVDEYSRITTIEGIGTAEHLHPIQQAFINFGAIQCGFCTPGFVISAKCLLDNNLSPTREEVRDWFQKHRNVCRCTGYKPIVDAVMNAAGVLRGESRFEEVTVENINTIYRSRYPRPSALAKVTGQCDYGDDIKLKMPDDTLHLAIVQAKVSHAEIISVNTEEAEAIPGVVKVITSKDVKGTNRIQMPLYHARSLANGFERPIISDKKIFRYGDVIAVVAAESESIARNAAAKVKLEYRQLPEYLTYLESVMPDALQIHEGIPNIYIQQPLIKGGGAQKVMESAPYVVEGSFYSGREPHLSVEPDVLQSYWDEQGNIVIHGKSQALYTTKETIAEGLGISLDKVRIIENPTGASFGYATSPGSYALVAACAMALDRPVTLTMSYEEHQHYSGKRTPSYSNAKLACAEDGKMIGAEFDVGIDHGAYTELAYALIEKVPRFMFFPYYIPNVTGLARMAATNHSFGTAYRGYGSPQAFTTGEALVDMMAEKIGMDPFEFRYLNIARKGQTHITDGPFPEYPMEQIMDTMRPIYEEAVKRAKLADTLERRRGVGLAWGGFNVTYGGFDKAQIALELNPDGTVSHFSTWEDQGQGGDIGALGVALEALKPLGLNAGQIRIVQNDSMLCPDTGMAAASRSHFMTGHATVDAADKLMNAMKRPDGSFRTYDEMIKEEIPTKYIGLCDLKDCGCTGMDPNTGTGNPSPSLMYGLYLAEVEVDAETGKTKVLSVTMVGDVGIIANHLAVEGQAYGGISHSIGFALSEQYENLKKHTNLASSGVPYIKDIPDEINLIHLENYRDNGPFGSTGCSELYQSGGHMAVINGIANAAGVRIYELPAMPDKVKAGMEALARGERILPPRQYFLGSGLYEEIEKIKNNPVSVY